MKVTVNRDTCVASGNCGAIAPDVFQNRDQDGGFVRLLQATPPTAQWDAVRQAAWLCPSATIHLENDRPAGESKHGAAPDRPGTLPP